MSNESDWKTLLLRCEKSYLAYTKDVTLTKKIKAEAANTADLQSKLIAKKLNEELHAKFGILYANTQL